MQIFLNGEFLPADQGHISVFDHGFLYGDGVYETLRTVRGEVFDLEAHYERLLHSAAILHITLPFSREEIFSATKEILKRNGFSKNAEARIRWTLTRGANEFDFSSSKKPTFVITAIELAPYPPEYFENGVAVTTLSTTRTLPEAKTISLLPMILGRQKCAESTAFECLFLEDGYITEGTVSNFCIQFENEVWTAPKEKVLAGTSAKIFLRKIKQMGFHVREKLFTPEEVISTAVSAFLTNSLFGVLPVRKIDGKLVGNGVIAPFLPDLIKSFWDFK